MKKYTTSKNPTKIIRHSCVNPTQDKIYGPGMRLANATKKVAGYRCTTCGQFE